MALKQDGKVMRGMAWRAAEREDLVVEHQAALDLAFSLEQETWNGERTCSSPSRTFERPKQPEWLPASAPGPKRLAPEA